MKNVKDRYQFIIGFAAIIISLSAFKEELNKILIDFGFISFTGASYLYALILSFVLIVHLYVILYILAETQYANFKIFNTLETISFTLFLFTLALPFILATVYILNTAFLWLSTIKPFVFNTRYADLLNAAISTTISTLFMVVINMLIDKYKKIRKKTEQAELEYEEIKSLEIANKLYREGYYYQSFVEAFKILENAIFKALRSRDLIFRKGDLNQMLAIARKYNIITSTEFDKVQAFQNSRNAGIQLLTSEITKAELDNLLSFIKNIFNKTEIKSTPIEESAPIEEFSNQYFKGKVFKDFSSAKQLSGEINKPIFMVIYDDSNPTKSKLKHALGYFTEYETTKNLIKENFIQVLVDKDVPNVAEFIPIEDPLENCLLVILTPNGTILRQEGVSGNPDVGLGRVRQAISDWANTTE
ncbi:hypothetical protein AHMF7605_22570 [Adhaeribacter arboris]|uniref:Uncharacterized protein n=1 Tax=Adhaeribacter arboris TaxID=2072846 RepID=A0A2T2YKP4_9BACT|nr:hypothetical protein [Adhaeribacter arboris]PSR56086.1 hypothetical protein AHMF7605_22570 [Adhaeribacter arboris]